MKLRVFFLILEECVVINFVIPFISLFGFYDSYLGLFCVYSSKVFPFMFTFPWPSVRITFAIADFLFKLLLFFSRRNYCFILFWILFYSYKVFLYFNYILPMLKLFDFSILFEFFNYFLLYIPFANFLKNLVPFFYLKEF